MLTIGTNPVQTVYLAQLIHHLLSLMETVLSPMENQLLLLHCGMGRGGEPVAFSHLAERFHLGNAMEAEDIFCAAVVKTRAAIPGSALETWIVSYRKSYHPGRSSLLVVNLHAPIPR